MNEPIDAAAANAAAGGFFAAMAELVKPVPGAYVRSAPDGTKLVFTGIPESMLNAVFVERERDLGTVADFARELSATGVPWSIRVHGAADPGVAQLAAEYDRTDVVRMPLQIWDAALSADLPTDLPQGATVRRLSGAETGVFADAFAAGFDLPKEIAEMFSLPAWFDAPNITAFALDLDGEVVATGFNVLVGDWVGMYSGSVPPAHRRKGYYRALVAERLRDAVASGARRAFTQNSPFSLPLYQSFGFRLAETWTYLTPGQPG
jgi:GNAT superfamily N-acetyltransferase